MIEAALWAALASSTLLAGAVIVRLAAPGARAIAVVMAVGSGVLIASVAYDLVQEASPRVGILAASGALLAGAVSFVFGARLVERKGGRHRKRPHGEHADSASTAKAIALGTVLDGIPESFVLGLSVLGGAVSGTLVSGIALSNLPEGMASTSGLLRSGWSMRRVLGMWAGVVVASATAAALGFAVLASAPAAVAAAVQMFAGGALFAMIVDSMIPEAYAIERDWTGLLVVVGFVGTLAMQAA